MRLSNYEMILPLIGADEKEIDDRALLVNGLYGAFDIVPKRCADFLIKGKFSQVDSSLWEQLARRGHITTKSLEEEIADLELLAHIDRRIIQKSRIDLIIMPTYDCNFRCPYCCERKRLARGETWLAKVMSHEMIQAIFAALDDYRSRGYGLGNCTLYGGEPLMKENLATVREIAENCAQREMKIEVLTNGYDLASFIPIIKEFPFVFVQVPLDGVGKTNDRLRRHKEGKDTYERILNNVDMALEHGIGVNMRINISKENLSSIDELTDDLKRRGFLAKENERRMGQNQRGEFVHYFKATVTPDRNSFLGEGGVARELLESGRSAEYVMEHSCLYGIVARYIRKLFQKDTYVDFSTAICNAERGALLVDPYGLLFPCWESVGDDDMAVGRVDETQGRVLWNFAKAKWRLRTSDRIPACRICPYNFFCKGGCAARAKDVYGDYFREYCGDHKQAFAFAASHIAGKMWQERGEAELSLSLAEPLAHLTRKERYMIMNSKSIPDVFAIVKKAGLLPQI